jgi:ATP-binding cassette, subfamily C, bacterial exporter for protease/lipase
MSAAMVSTTPAAPIAPAARGAPPGDALRKALKGFRYEAFWVLVFGCFSNLLVLTPTIYMLQVFDRVFHSGSEFTLAAVSALALVFYLVMGFADWARSRLLVRAGTRFDELIQPDVFRASFDAQLRSVSGNNTQALNDVTQLRQFLTGNGIFAIVDTPWAVIYTGVLFLMHPWLGWLAVVFVVLNFVLALVGNRLLARSLEVAQKAQVDNTGYLAGKLRNAETVEAMGMLGNLRRRWFTLHDDLHHKNASAAESSHRMQSLMKFMQYSQQSLVLALGALLAIDGKISAGAMIASNALLGNALRPISTLVASWKPFIETRAAYIRLVQILDDNPPRENPHVADAVRGQITLTGLVAKAPRREKPILQGIDAEFKAGEVVAIVGPSGAGKSTLARCLLGIWPAAEGEVTLDGVALQRWSRDALGPHIGYLPQDIELFEGTIAENIARFQPEMDTAVIDAAKRTGIHDMVLRLPKGYDTPMGEAGNQLSGGQRQRIGLARAIVGDPAVVVLDEPNANLDDAGDAALLKTVLDLKSRGKTVFMIVHQKHLLAAADRVAVLEGGRLTQLAQIQRAEPQAQVVTTP